MANTYYQIYMQIIFAVKGRQCFIKESIREEIQKYMAGIIANKKQKLYAIYCMPDHTHIFVSMSRICPFRTLFVISKPILHPLLKKKNGETIC
jgi:REP element-mobilizing transposase RayT